jgi:hypothetical protein
VLPGLPPAGDCRADTARRDTWLVPELEVRQPLAVRIVFLAIPAVLVLSAARALMLPVLHHQDVSGALAAIGVAALAVTLGYRNAALSFRASGQELVVHNYRRTRHVQIGQVEGLDIGRTTGGSLLTVRILANGSIIPIDVLGSRQGILGGRNPAAVKERERRRAELADPGWRRPPARSEKDSRRQACDRQARPAPGPAVSGHSAKRRRSGHSRWPDRCQSHTRRRRSLSPRALASRDAEVSNGNSREGSAWTWLQEWVSLDMRRVANYGTEQPRLRWSLRRDGGVMAAPLSLGRASLGLAAGLLLVPFGSMGGAAVHASTARVMSAASTTCAKRPSASAGTTDAKSAAVLAATAAPSASASASPSTPAATASATPTPTATDPSPAATSPSPSSTATPSPTPSATPTPTPSKSPKPSPSPSPSAKTPKLCASVQPYSSSSVQPGDTASYEIFVWSTAAEAEGATVSVSMGGAAHVQSPYFKVCSDAKGAVCTVGALPTSQSDELIAAVRVRDAAPNGEKITLTATVKATKATSVGAKATIDVTVPSSTAGSGSTSTSGDGGVGDGIPGTYIPNLNDGGLTNTSGQDPSGLFPTVTPSASASTAKSKKDPNVNATTVSSTLPLNSRLIGGQLAGLAVLASAIAIAVARLSLRTQRPSDSGGDSQQK